jgi:hypothetical protein
MVQHGAAWRSLSQLMRAYGPGIVLLIINFSLAIKLCL